MFESPPFWMYFVGFLALLGPLVTVHELGHYLVGRWFGVKAEAFSIGFGKEIAGWTDKQGTRWKLSWLPLGGYVQFKGDMNPASIPDPNAPVKHDDGSFHGAALWKRALIVAAGPITNLLLAIAIFFAFNLSYGEPIPANPEELGVIAGFTEDSPARDAGMQVGDRIVAIDGEEVVGWRSVQRSIQPYLDREFQITVERGSERLDLSITSREHVQKDLFGNEHRMGLIGVEPVDVEERFRSLGVGESFTRAIGQCVDVVEMILTGIKQILFGERSIKELGGPLKIAKFSGERLSLGMTEFVFFSALISLNLAFINFLPIPALDGGHLAFYAAEAIRRKPVGPQATEWAYRTGIMLVLVFMVVVTWNDITSLLSFGS